MIHRSLIRPAAYNPRSIDPHSRAKLKKTIQKGGLVEALVWNRQTGNLCGGHQRLSILDELEEGTDYSIEVCVLDVPLLREKEINIALNQTGMMGDWNTDVLASLLPELNMEAVGFDRLDVESLMPDLDTSALFSDLNDDSGLKKDAKTIAEMKDERKRYKEQGKQKNDASYMLHIVFGSCEEAGRFLTRVNIHEAEEYIDGRRLAANCGIDLDQGD